MSSTEVSGWGHDEWLMDREIRRGVLRSIALHHLAEQILRTPASPGDALACVLDEVFADASPLPPAKIARCVREDVLRFGTWLRSGVTKGSRVATKSKALTVVVPDGPPYEMQLAFVNGKPVEDTWADSIAWRSSEKVILALLDQLLPRTKKLGADVRRDADYILPLAYSAFLLRGALRSLPKQRAGYSAVISYDGGDSLIVPLT